MLLVSVFFVLSNVHCFVPLFMGFCSYCDYCCSFWVGELLDCNSIWGENGGMYENFDGCETEEIQL